jgi:hypothetical protein
MRSLRRLVVVVATIVALTVLVPSVSAASPLGEVHLTKTCSPTFPTPATCTVQTAPYGPIPVGTVATYSGLFFPVLSAAVVLTITTGDTVTGTATGHCALRWQPELTGATGHGTCVFVSGTGSLAGFHANLKISDHPWITYWDGTYFFAPAH